jgi:hypothetical protein
MVCVALRGTMPPMLSTCTVPGCSTIVFGHGTCVEHDRVADAADVGHAAGATVAPVCATPERDEPVTVAAAEPGDSA